ncbi:MAG: hypothetical protein NT154_31745, partial [Verrucomicrobia bacterium]|nr:hypothetical protein [Verrucomicrobiota bacterium]
VSAANPLYSDDLTGLALAEWRGNEEEWETTLAAAQDRLLTNPDDTYLRAMITWSALTRGSPTQVVDVISETARWLDSDVDGSTDGSLPVNAEIFDSARNKIGSDWFADSLQKVEEWICRELDSGLARLIWLWLVARGKTRDQMSVIVQQSRSWLLSYPDDAAVRWMAMWLSVFSERAASQTGSLIAETEEWLIRGAPKDECLIRAELFWLVACEGDAKEVERAIKAARKWFQGHPADDFVHLAYLFYLVRRRGTPSQRRIAIEETHKFLSDAADTRPFTVLALELVEAADGS